MKLKDKKMLIVNLPPPYGGGEMLNQYLFNYFRNRSDFIIINIGKSAQKKNQQGRLSFSNIIFGLKSNITVIYSVIKYRPSLVYFLVPKSFLPFLKMIPIILLCHYFRIYSIGSLEGNSFYFLNKKNYLQSRIGTLLLKKVNIIRVLGNSIGENMHYNDLYNTVVVPNGVEVPSYLITERKEKLDNQLVKFLFVGVLAEFKGISNLINSFIIFLKTTKNVQLHLIGEWYSLELKKELEGEIKKNNLSEYFFFHGLQHNQDKWNLFREMDIYVHLSKLDGQPLSILEAMGCGMPIISTKVGAIPETVVENFNGFLIDEADSSQIVKTFQKYLNNYSLIAEHSANSVKLYNQFYSLPKFLERMENLFDLDSKKRMTLKNSIQQLRNSKKIGTVQIKAK